MKKIAVILAGGDGTRAGGGEPKQFRSVAGHPMLEWSIRAFAEENRQTRIILVVHPSFLHEWAHRLENISNIYGIESILVCGGIDRFHSVKNALMEISDSERAIVAVHDAARPMLTSDLICAGWIEAEKHSAAIPVIPVTDSLRKIESDGRNVSVRRKDFVSVQTPQFFDVALLKSSYDAAQSSSGFTDDASVVEAAGKKIALFEGNPDNFKVTHPVDFIEADAILKLREADNDKDR